MTIDSMGFFDRTEKRRVAQVPGQQKPAPTTSSTSTGGSNGRSVRAGGIVQLMPIDIHSKKLPYRDRCKYLKMIYDEFLKIDSSMGQQEAMQNVIPIRITCQ